MPALADAAAARVLAGRYRLVRLLGAGGMGEVWEAEQLGLARRVAVKLIRPELARDPALVDRFHREALAAAALKVAGVVTIHDNGVAEDGAPFLVMELLDGETLAERIEREGKLSIDLAREVLRQLFEVLRAAHEAGIVHRDLKPENIFLPRTEGALAIKLLDFGIAKLRTAAAPARSRTRTGSVMGTPAYMSPEQCDGREVDARSDLYSLGVVLFEMLTGAPPFDDESPSVLMGMHVRMPPPRLELRGSFPPELCALAARLLAKRPEDRFGSAKDALDVLLPSAATAPKRAHLSPWIALGVAIVGMSAMASAAWLAWPSGAPPAPQPIAARAPVSEAEAVVFEPAADAPPPPVAQASDAGVPRQAPVRSAMDRRLPHVGRLRPTTRNPYGGSP